MLGNLKLDDTECPVVKPSVVEGCKTNVLCPQSCSPTSNCDYIPIQYCKATDPRHQALLESLCKTNCCSCDCTK